MKYITVILLLSALIASCSATPDKKVHVADKGAIALSDSNRIPEVTVMELQPTVFNHEVVSNGRISAREKVDVNFRTPGLITAIYVRNGQRVAKGERLAQIDTYKLGNQLEKEQGAVASATLEMQDVLIGQGYDPEHPEEVPEDIMALARLRSGLRQAELNLASIRKELDDATLFAPVSGVIANLTATPHNMSSSYEPLCRIINDSGMEVGFSVLESELPMVRPGDQVSVTPFAITDMRTGRVTEINPMVDENGMVRVRAAVDDGRGMMDGMNVRVSVRRALDKTLVVPKSAVVLRSGRQVVFTLEGDKAMWNYVTTGLENLTQYTITDGLTPGMTVITSGNVNLAHESAVHVVDK